LSWLPQFRLISVFFHHNCQLFQPYSVQCFVSIPFAFQYPVQWTILPFFSRILTNFVHSHTRSTEGGGQICVDGLCWRKPYETDCISERRSLACFRGRRTSCTHSVYTFPWDILHNDIVKLKLAFYWHTCIPERQITEKKR
jgi:hypothetical protein